MFLFFLVTAWFGLGWELDIHQKSILYRNIKSVMKIIVFASQDALETPFIIAEWDIIHIGRTWIIGQAYNYLENLFNIDYESRSQSIH
jgi:hypothetical protein